MTLETVSCDVNLDFAGVHERASQRGGTWGLWASGLARRQGGEFVPPIKRYRDAPALHPPDHLPHLMSFRSFSFISIVAWCSSSACFNLFASRCSLSLRARHAARASVLLCAVSRTKCSASRCAVPCARVQQRHWLQAPRCFRFAGLPVAVPRFLVQLCSPQVQLLYLLFNACIRAFIACTSCCIWAVRCSAIIRFRALRAAPPAAPEQVFYTWVARALLVHCVSSE